MVLQLLLLIAFGLAQLFFGYALFRWLVMLAGAAVGFFYAPQLLTAGSPLPPEPWVAVVAALVGALVLGALAWFAFRVVVFLWGFSVGYGLAVAFTSEVLFALLAGLLVGVLAMFFQRVLIVALTAVSGASLIVFASSGLLGLQPPPGLSPLAVQPWLGVATLVLAALGAVAQYRRPAAPSRVRA